MIMLRFKLNAYACAGRLGVVALLGMVALSARAQFIGPGPGATAVRSTPVEARDSTLLLSGDLIEVRIFGVAAFDFKGRLADDGTVTMPLVGTLQVGGMTAAAAEQAMAQRLVDLELMKQPQVNVLVLESPSHVATVSGEVKTPGPVPIYGKKRLLEVLSAAGGLTPASSPSVTIYRRGVQSPFQVVIPADSSASDSFNIVIVPGDTLVVAKVGVVYVLGAFHAQGAIPLKNTTSLTLIQAMSMAGGINYEAALTKAYLLRSAPGGRQEIHFNVADVMHHRVPDMTLQNDDVVLVPSNNLKAALKGGAAAVAASLLAGVGYIVVTR